MVYLSVKELAARWGVSRSVVYTLIAAGALPHLRVGLGRGAIRVRAADAEAFERDRRRSDAADIAEHIGATNPRQSRE